MADSLIIANSIELLGGEAVSADPRFPGAQFMLAPGFSLGAPQPTTDFVASLILDGERPFGRRSSNRTITLPIVIKALTRASLAAAREALEGAINQQTWTLTWTRDPGPGGTPLPLVFDCFRAQPTVPAYNTNYEKQANIGLLTITFQALPYGRADVQQQISFAAPVPATPPPPPAPVVLDDFTTISSTQFQQSSQCVVGPHTACWDPDRFGDPGGRLTPLTYPSTFTTPLNLTQMTSLQLWFGVGSRYYCNLHDRAGCIKASFYMTLTDTNGVTLAFSRANVTLPSSQDPNNPAFTRITLTIPQNSATFNYASVASYLLTVTNRDSSPRLAWVTGYLDALTAYPASQTVTPVTRGNVYTLYGVQGTAHTPVSLQFQQAPVAGTPTTLTTVGAGTYTVPALTAYLKVECVGGGGAGATQTVAGFGGGGGGAEYAAEAVFPAAPAQTIPYSVGAGAVPGADGQATVFGPGPSGALIVSADGGDSAAQNTITGGTGGAGSGNSVHYPGGQGRTASGSVGGGGGSSAGNATAGLTPMGSAAVLFTSGSGNWTCPAGVTSVLAECWGAGGGGGGGGSVTNGCGGGGGEYSAQTLTVVPGTNYAYVVGAGGAGAGSGGNLPGSAGANTTFTVGATVVTGHAGGGGPATNNNAPGGAGGSGSSAPTHFTGGPGGSSYPYSGGGGSSAGIAAAGNSGNGYGGAGSAPSGGGAGGAGSGGHSGNGTAGSAPGGGGGGTYANGYTGGPGAAGQVRITYPGGAPTNNGAAAVSGGGAGGAGGPSANTAGSAGSVPGGGGGGADSSGTTEAGGAGGAGHIVVTPYASPAFKTLIVHRPSPDGPQMFSPLVSVGGGTGVPNGATEYTLPQPVSGVNADLNGTYTLVLISNTWHSPTVARNITVTVKQYEYSGGASYSTSTTPISITPTGQVNNGILIAGVLTLPMKAVAPDNTGGYYTVAVTSSDTADRFYDLILLDTMGQTVIINEPSSGYIQFFLDEPDPTTDLGRHMGSQLGRPNAISVMDACQAISGGPLTIPPHESTLFAYSQEGAPSIGVSYYARYFFDRTS
jgi:hypothetical protein